LKIFRFVIESYVFKRIAVITALFLILIFWGFNKLFDSVWVSYSSVPLLYLNNVYKPPKNYDNLKRLNLALANDNKLAIESNKIFKVAGKQKNYDYFDTTDIQFPDQTNEVTNKIFLEFAGSLHLDSILLVTSKSREKIFFWRQIFHSTVIIEKLNNFSEDSDGFRVNENTLVEQPLLDNNDTLIYKVLNYFETNKEKLNLGDCGVNSATFRDICIKFSLPCRPVGLMGGDASQVGNFTDLGYPAHALCEVYSSKYKKWYVIDPTYGLRFRNTGSDDYLNAVEICNMIFFQREKFIAQDSVLSTKRTTLGRDYFKYYENIYFLPEKLERKSIVKFFQLLFNKFNINGYHYTNLLVPLNNGFYYVGAKSFIYLLLLIIYFNIALAVITRRLFSAKKPKHFINDREHFYTEKQKQQA